MDKIYDYFAAIHQFNVFDWGSVVTLIPTPTSSFFSISVSKIVIIVWTQKKKSPHDC